MKTENYQILRTYLNTVPIIDCHDHTSVCGPKYADPIQVITGGYFSHDLISASSDAEVQQLTDGEKSVEDRWPLLQRIWGNSCHTGYARVTKMLLKEFYEVEELSLESLQSMQSRLMDLSDAALFDSVLDKANIVARLLDVLGGELEPADDLKPSPRGHFVISLPRFHSVTSYAAVSANISHTAKNITSLDEYITECRRSFQQLVEKGCVAFKDQSAYQRPIDYGNPTKHAAEKIFNWIMEDPRRTASYPDGVKDLDDFLFHEFMRMARDLELPVQIHTGHMAGVRNEIDKTNALGLTRILELHRDVQFDLFHANWPHGDDLLFLGKNYPNVHLDFCWTNIIDPEYCRIFFKRIVTSVPHGKIHAYGSDFGGYADRAWAHAEIARDNVAQALSELVDSQYISMEEAQEISEKWFFHNPNEFFKLNLNLREVSPHHGKS